MMVADLYHHRWQIEFFFKWLKQHLKIKKFRGNSENAVRIQIYSAEISPNGEILGALCRCEMPQAGYVDERFRERIEGFNSRQQY